jgi:hypothetical protein
VRGTLTLRTSAPIECRGVRLEFSCKSSVHWVERHGDDTVDYYGDKKYCSLRQTVWGNFYSTLVKNECGADCFFGESAGDGDLDIALNTRSTPLGSFKVVVRAMDYDFGKKDDLRTRVPRLHSRQRIRY